MSRQPRRSVVVASSTPHRDQLEDWLDGHPDPLLLDTPSKILQHLRRSGLARYQRGDLDSIRAYAKAKGYLR